MGAGLGGIPTHNRHCLWQSRHLRLELPACSWLLATVVLQLTFDGGLGDSVGRYLGPAYTSCLSPGVNCKQVLGEVEESPDDAHEHEEVPPEQREKENEEKRKALYDIMSCMRDIRKRTERTDAMFEPLRATVAVLNGFGIALPETVLQQLENAGE